MHFNVEYVKEFYKISSGEILAGQLKQCILKHAQSHNTSEWKDDLWAGKIASQLVCLLSHVRRLRRDAAKRRQCMQGATGEQRQAIQELVALPASCKKATIPVQGSPASGDGQACKKAKKTRDPALFLLLLRPRPARRPRVPVLLLCLLLKEPRPARRPGF